MCQKSITIQQIRVKGNRVKLIKNKLILSQIYFIPQSKRTIIIIMIATNKEFKTQNVCYCVPTQGYLQENIATILIRIINKYKL